MVSVDPVKDIEDVPTDKEDSSPKAVEFAPLSPQSSHTLRRHHAEIEQTARKSAQVSDEDDIEELPDRFDAQGRPLSNGATSSHGFSSRQGDFSFGDRVRGKWGVASTEGDGDVEWLADSVQTILDGIGGASSGHPSGIMGIIGGVLQGLALGGDENHRLEDADHHSDDGKKRKRRNTHGGDAWSTRDRRARERDWEWEWDHSAERDGAAPTDYGNGSYMFDRDGYDGHDARKRRRSWTS